MKPNRIMKECVKCHLEKEASAFYDKHNRDTCKKCVNKAQYAKQVGYHAKWRSMNRDRVLNNRRVHRFGMTSAQYNKILIEQKSVCAICFLKNENGRALSIDHNHSTKKNRGLLCQHCNFAIGLLKENPLILKSAIAYLEKHNEAVERYN